MIITAAIHRGDKQLCLEELTLDAPRADEVLVQVVACGLCHTDVAVMNGDLPIPKSPCVLGHEGSGIVLDLGKAVTGFTVGDHVVMSFASCGSCVRCTSGDPAYCDSFLQLNFFGRRADGSCTRHSAGSDIQGSFFGQSSLATHALVNSRHLIKVPQDIPFEHLAPLGCGVQTGAGAIINCLKPQAGSTLAVFGAGAVGLAAIMAANLREPKRIIAIDLNKERLRVARRLGATDLIDATAVDINETIKALTSGRGVDYAVEATGNAAVMEKAILSLGTRGTAILLGLPTANAVLSLSARALTNGRTVISSTEGDSIPSKFIPELIDLYRLGSLPLNELISEYPLDQVNDAVRDSSSGKVIKAVIRMQG